MDAESEAWRRLGYHPTMHVEKPLLGFGWMGWVLLAIAGALVVVWVTGYDLQYQLLAITRSLFGNDGAFFVAAYLSLLGAKCTHENALAHFGLWGLCASLIAIQIYPMRISLWRILLLIAWAVSAPMLSVYTSRFVYKIMPDSTSIIVFYNTNYFIESMIAGLLLVLISRSFRVAVGVSLLIGMTIMLTSISARYGFQSRPAWFVTFERIYPWLWNPLLLAVLLSWAIPARIRFSRWWLCFQCGYNMRNLGTNTCPECGAVNERMPVAGMTARSNDS